MAREIEHKRREIIWRLEALEVQKAWRLEVLEAEKNIAAIARQDFAAAATAKERIQAAREELAAQASGPLAASAPVAGSSGATGEEQRREVLARLEALETEKAAAIAREDFAAAAAAKERIEAAREQRAESTEQRKERVLARLEALRTLHDSQLP